MRAISIPFRFEFGGVADTRDPHEIARAEIINVLVTGRYERVMRPGYGAGVYSLLFDIADPLVHADWKRDALRHINDHVTVAHVSDVNVSETGEDRISQAMGIVNTTLYITVRYRIPPEDVQSFSFTLVNPQALTAETPMLR